MITNVTQKLVHNEQSQLNDSNNQDDTEKKQTVKSLLTSTNINVEVSKKYLIKFLYTYIKLLVFNRICIIFGLIFHKRF